MSGGGQFPFGNNSGNNSAKSSFQLLEAAEGDRRHDLLSSPSNNEQSMATRFQTAAVAVDMMVAIYINIIQGNLLKLSSNNGDRTIAVILTLAMAVSGYVTATRGSSTARNVWMGSRTLFFIFATIFAGLYFQNRVLGQQYYGRSGSFADCLPMIVCGLGLGLGFFSRQ